MSEIGEYLSMVDLLGKIGELLVTTKYQLKASRGTLAVGVYEFDDEQGVAPTVAVVDMEGKKVGCRQTNSLLDRVAHVALAENKGRTYSVKHCPALCLRIGTAQKQLGAVIITAKLGKRDKAINEALAIGNIIRWIQENVEENEGVKVLSVYGIFAGGQTLYDVQFTQ